jgi:hypothetical protein
MMVLSSVSGVKERSGMGCRSCAPPAAFDPDARDFDVDPVAFFLAIAGTSSNTPLPGRRNGKSLPTQ